MQTGRHANWQAACGPSGQACHRANRQTCSHAERLASMLPAMRGAITRMGQGLPDKRSAANPIRQPGPLSGQAEPDRPLARAPSRNRPAPGASSNEGVRDNGARSNREGWLGMVWKGQCALPFRCDASDGDAVGWGPCPRRDRTQISEAPQAVESLHKCALDLYRPTGTRLTLPRQCSMQPQDVLNFRRV